MVTSTIAALGSRKPTERAGRRLKAVSGVVMLVLGNVLLVRPDWLLQPPGWA